MSIRKVFAEFLGTFTLVATVVGSGAMAQSLTQDVGLQLLINALATIFVLGIVIHLFGPLSGAHFNPIVTLFELFRGSLTKSLAGAYLLAQFVGATTGAMIANLMYKHPAIYLSDHVRRGFSLYLGEVIATAGLIFIIYYLANTPRSSSLTLAIPAWIGSAYFFTSSTSFANPAVTFGRAFSNTFSGIAFESVAAFVVAQLIGGLIGYIAAAFFKSGE